MVRRAVFLDRDGVLTVPEFRDGRSYAPVRLEDFRLYDDAPGAVARLRAAGFLVIVATNQPDVTTGRLDPAVLERMHERLLGAIPLDGIEISTATRAAPDRRRKPAPGMLIDAGLKWGIDLAASYMVGDRASDLAAGRAAGCRTVFVDRGYTADEPPGPAEASVADLAGAAEWILSDAGRR